MNFAYVDKFDEINENHESIWWVKEDVEQYDEMKKFLKDVYYESILHVYERLTDEGLLPYFGIN